MKNIQLIKETSSEDQKKFKNCLIKLQGKKNTKKLIKVSLRYMLWLHHYLSTGKINVKDGVIKIAKNRK